MDINKRKRLMSESEQELEHTRVVNRLQAKTRHINHLRSLIRQMETALLDQNTWVQIKGRNYEFPLDKQYIRPLLDMWYEELEEAINKEFGSEIAHAGERRKKGLHEETNY